MTLSDRTIRPQGRWAASEATTAQVTDSVVSTWQDIHMTLSPIIGVRGVTALYERSLGLASASLPWLTSVARTSQTEMDLAALRGALLERGLADAAEVGNAMFLACQGLLAGLLGTSLADRLLRSVWTQSSGSSASGSSTDASS